MNTTKQTLRFYWYHTRRYPYLLLGIFISAPLTVLAGSFLPPLIVASVINRLSEHAFIPHNIWASFGPDLIVYAALQILSEVVG